MSWTPFLPDPRYAARGREGGGGVAVRESVALAFVCAAYVATTVGFGDPARAVAWVGLGIVMFAGAAGRGGWQGWAVVAAGLALGIAGRPLAVANHHYVLTWASLALALALSAPVDERRTLVRHNARWLLVAIMGFATVHKLISGPFMDGSFLGFGIATGAFAEPLLQFCPSCLESIGRNVAAVGEFRTTVPEAGAAVTLIDPVPNLPAVARGFGLATLLVEAVLFALFLFVPRARATHLLLLAFAAGLGVNRQELTFISVVAVLGFMSCPAEHARLRWAYLAAAVAFSGLAIY